MRSTGFVVLSIAVHGICVMALVLTPIRTVSNAGDKIEVSIGEPAEKPGIKEAAPSPEESKPQVVAEPEPIAKAVPTPTPAAPAPKKVVKAAKPKAAVAALPKKESTPEKLDPVIEDKDSTAVVKTEPVVSEDVKEQTKPESKDVLVPVKETAPAGVEAAASEAETEAKSEDVQKTSDPTPVAAATATSAAETGDLTKGGASKEGAVSYLDLKQMPGNKAPKYPMQARLEKRQGNLELLYRVTKEGKVTDIQVTKSSGFKDIDSEAVKAIAQFKFVPGQEGWAKHPVSFNLKGPVAAMPSRLRGKGAQAD